MSRQNHNMCKIHDRGKSTLKASSKKRYFLEKKEMDHEFSHHENQVQKLLNENFQHLSTVRRKEGYLVRFEHPNTHEHEQLLFQFESNLKHLEDSWK